MSEMPALSAMDLYGFTGDYSGSIGEGSWRTSPPESFYTFRFSPAVVRLDYGDRSIFGMSFPDYEHRVFLLLWNEWSFGQGANTARIAVAPLDAEPATMTREAERELCRRLLLGWHAGSATTIRLLDGSVAFGVEDGLVRSIAIDAEFRASSADTWIDHVKIKGKFRGQVARTPWYFRGKAGRPPL